MYMYFNKESGKNGEVNKDPLTHQVIGCAIKVHRTLGPGLLESTYEKFLAHEPKLAGTLLSSRRLFTFSSLFSLSSL